MKRAQDVPVEVIAESVSRFAFHFLLAKGVQVKSRQLDRRFGVPRFEQTGREQQSFPVIPWNFTPMGVEPARIREGGEALGVLQNCGHLQGPQLHAEGRIRVRIRIGRILQPHRLLVHHVPNSAGGAVHGRRNPNPLAVKHREFVRCDFHAMADGVERGTRILGKGRQCQQKFLQGFSDPFRIEIRRRAHEKTGLHFLRLSVGHRNSHMASGMGHHNHAKWIRQLFYKGGGISILPER